MTKGTWVYPKPEPWMLQSMSRLQYARMFVSRHALRSVFCALDF